MKKEIKQTIYEYMVYTLDGAIKVQLSEDNLMLLLNNIQNDIGWEEIEKKIKPSNWGW